MSLPLMCELWRLTRQQRADPDEIDRIALLKLRRQVTRAWEHTDFYRRKFSSVGFRPEDMKSLQALQRLPVTTKTELQEAGPLAICADLKPSDLVWLKTSGSSGSPMSVPFTKQDKSHRVLKELRALFANGYKPSDLMMIFVEPRCVVEEKNWLQRAGLLRRHYLSIFAGDSRHIEEINSLRPQVIYGYTSTLRILAERLLAGPGIASSPKILMSAAELMDPTTRRLITDAFGSEPADFYGSMEFGWIAWQCPERRGYHINSDCLILECLKNGKPAAAGEEGELVITNLHSDAAPLIRYASGDVGVLSDDLCSCGCKLPLLSSVNGRLADCLTVSDGLKLSPYSVTCAIEDVPGVHQYQVIQERAGRITVRLLPGEQVVDTKLVRQAVVEALHGWTDVVVEHVDSLLTEPNGKFKVVKSMSALAPDEVTSDRGSRVRQA